KRNPLEWLIDMGFHATIQRRFEMVMEEHAPFEGKRFLDAGCGSGRYAVELGVRGAREVVGVDFAQNMLGIAAASAKERGVAEVCQFVQSDFLLYEPEAPFDALVSVGFFEYFTDVQGLFDKAASMTQGKMTITFPKAGGFRAAIRKWRYAYNKCYLRLFDKAEVTQLVKNCATPIVRWQLRETDRDFVLVAETK
ncbi:MAG: class I SAM-dependent methyltransferase, partial [bacterium]